MSLFSKIFKSKKQKSKAALQMKAKLRTSTKPVHDDIEVKVANIKKRPSIHSSNFSYIVRIDGKPFKDIERVKLLTLNFITNQKTKNSSIFEINIFVAQQLTNTDEEARNATEIKEIRNNLAIARKELKKEGLLGYSSKKKLWFIKTQSKPKSRTKTKTIDTTQKERNFLKHIGHGEGWERIDNKLEAVKWLHKNFGDDEFEYFCCALLNHCHVQELRVSHKRKSGADGGIDGTGTISLENGHVQIVFEAKRYNSKYQVGSDICQKLAGAMGENNIKHGFIITTSVFSDRAWITKENLEKNQGLMIEYIDQERMADLMLEKGDGLHGFGLLQTEDYGWIYMNKDILKKSVK